MPQNAVSTLELNALLAEVTHETGRQVGVLVNRKGQVENVVVGDAHKLELPDVGRQRAGRGRLRGLRLIHTHVGDEALTKDDLTDLALLRLDLVAALAVTDDGRPGTWYAAHVAPELKGGPLWTLLPARPAHEALDLDFERFIRELEGELGKGPSVAEVAGGPRAILVQVTTPSSADADVTLHELRELAATAGVMVVDEMRQRRPQMDPRTAIGKGKLEELALRAMTKSADLAIFDLNLSPAQVRTIAEESDLKVIDRTQLILDIFAQRARTSEGKLQVELAQMRYLLPRLSKASTAFSRLTGGIGGRGPGEQKLEIDRRRIRERMKLVEKELEKVGRGRAVRRSKRGKSRVPVVSIVGYTNAGKSTLLNTLTNSEVLAEDKLFATLDPTSRRLRFPQEREVVITDTVGFIRDLPADLVRAFKATLEELEDADLLLHVVDVSASTAEDHLATVDGILSQLDLDGRPVLRVLNKIDLVADPEMREALERRYDGVAVSARDAESLRPLLARIEATLWQERNESYDLLRDPP